MYHEYRSCAGISYQDSHPILLLFCMLMLNTLQTLDAILFKISNKRCSSVRLLNCVQTIEKTRSLRLVRMESIKNLLFS